MENEILGASGRKSQGDAEPTYSTSLPRWVPIAIFALFIGLCGYAVYSNNQIQKVAEVNEQAIASSNKSTQALITDLHDQQAATNRTVDALREQLGVTRAALDRKTNELATRVREEQRQSDEVLGAQIGQVARANQATQERVGQVATDLGGAKTDIAATAKDLADTKARLTTAVGDLTGQGTLIARTRGELEALRSLGDRDIVDINLTKSKQFQRVGSIQLRLNSADVKRNRYTMTVSADDKPVEKKDKTVNEPVQFYVQGARAPHEIVIFKVEKDRIIGYLSAPKPTLRQ